MGVSSCCVGVVSRYGLLSLKLATMIYHLSRLALAVEFLDVYIVIVIIIIQVLKVIISVHSMNKACAYCIF